MAHTATSTNTYSWTEADVEAVVSRFHADLKMIAQSTGTWTEKKVMDVAHDVDYLSKRGYLKEAHLMLFQNGVEQRAAVYTVNDTAGELKSDRPGGAMWPRLSEATLRIVLTYTKYYTDSARVTAKNSLKISWSSTKLSTSHAGLSGASGRNYSKNGWAMQRKDFT